MENKEPDIMVNLNVDVNYVIDNCAFDLLRFRFARRHKLVRFAIPGMPNFTWFPKEFDDHLLSSIPGFEEIITDSEIMSLNLPNLGDDLSNFNDFDWDVSNPMLIQDLLCIKIAYLEARVRELMKDIDGLKKKLE